MKQLMIIVLSMLATLVYSQQITNVEYYFDEDPGFGNAQSISISSSDDIEINDHIDVSSLNPGFHTFNIRTKDESNQWSSVLTKSFYIEKTLGEALPIELIEYFYDNDPGYGNAIAYTDFNSASNIEEIFMAGVGGLNEGLHHFNIRLKNNQGMWSQTFSQEFELLNCDLGISGTVMHQDQSPVSDAEIILYQFFEEGAAIGIDTIPLIDGNYQFDNVCPMSHYFLKVIPYSTDSFLPSYYGNTTYWQQASIISTEESNISGVNIRVVDFINIEVGNSTVGGHIYYAEAKGEPVLNVDVVLEYDNPDKFDGYQAVAYDRTDEAGEWMMDDLPIGNYRIKVEIPGLEMDTTYYVGIESELTSITNLDFYVDLQNGIFIDHFGIPENELLGDITIFPNPVVNGVFRISKDDKVIIQSIRIYSYFGKLIQEKKGNDDGFLILENPHTKGFYLMELKTNKGVFIRKIIVE